MGLRILHFGSANRVQGKGQPFDVLKLGRVTLSPDGTGAVKYWLYDARQDLPPIRTGVKHPQHDAGGAPPGYIEIPRYADNPLLPCKWEESGDRLTLQVGDALHVWTQRADGCYQLAGPHKSVSGTDTIAGLKYLEGRGYAAWSEQSSTPPAPITNLPRRLTGADFLPLYSGELCTLIGGAARWQDRTPCSFRAGDFKETANRDVLADAWTDPPTDPETPGMRVYASLLLNYASTSKLMLYYAGGHDYNHDRAADEPGHTWHWYGCWQGGKVGSIVGVECSYQSRGYPICSVVLYHGANP